jgi:nucleotide-binding universal stress UspA family protein
MKILIAVDPSPHSQEAVQFVKSVDWPKNIEIYLMNIIEMKHAPPLLPSGGPSSWDRVIAEARGELFTEAKEFLEQTKKTILGRRSFPVHSFVREGLPGAEILQAIEEYQIDLIILGTRGLSNVKRFLLGSTSDQIMREASCSVLLVRKKLSRLTMGKTASNVLLATDGSSGARSMVHMLSLLNYKTSPKVTVIHVVGKPAFLEGWFWGKGKTELNQLGEQLQEKAEQEGIRHLEEISQKLQELSLNVETKLVTGDPADEIITTAEGVKAKLLIVGLRGIQEGKPMPLGEVVRKVSRYAPCSVLVTRPGKPTSGA